MNVPQNLTIHLYNVMYLNWQSSHFTKCSHKVYMYDVMVHKCMNEVCVIGPVCK